ncbi:MAG: NUDIX domain-containing protein [Candidatus Pacearchaeota archaeon]
MKQASVILFYDKAGRMLLQDRKKISKFGEEYGFFGGSGEGNEDAQETLKRELMEELELDIQNARLFESHIYFSESSQESKKRNFYLAPMPDISKLKCHEGEMVILDIEDCAMLNMLQGQLELLKKAHAYLIDQKIVKPKKK